MTNSPERQPNLYLEQNRKREVKEVAKIVEVIMELLSPNYTISEPNDPHIWLLYAISSVNQGSIDKDTMLEMFKDFCVKLLAYSRTENSQINSFYVDDKSRLYLTVLTPALQRLSPNSNSVLFNKLKQELLRILNIINAQNKTTELQLNSISNQKDNILVKHNFQKFFAMRPDFTKTEKDRIYQTMLNPIQITEFSKSDIFEVLRNPNNSNQCLIRYADDTEKIINLT